MMCDHDVGVGSISIWCVPFSVNFSSATFEGPPEPIPTVSQWGFVVLVMHPLTAGTLLYGRSRSGCHAG